MKYFYTDPLAAAFMAKHFGMIFWTGCEDASPDDADNIRSALEEEAITGNPSEGRFHIHSESLHLLEAKIGDLLTGPNGKVAMFYMGDTNPSSRCPIIQRDGKPFHWPESE